MTHRLLKRKLRIDLRDLHAEHVDLPDEIECDHGDHELRVGDKLRYTATMEAPAWTIASQIIKCETVVTLEYLDEDHIKLTTEMPDYLAYKAAKEQQASNGNGASPDAEPDTQEEANGEPAHSV